MVIAPACSTPLLLYGQQGFNLVHLIFNLLAVVGVLKGLLAVVLGFFLMGGVGPRISPLNVAGIALNCTGGVWCVRPGRGVGTYRTLPCCGIALSCSRLQSHVFNYACSPVV